MSHPVKVRFREIGAGDKFSGFSLGDAAFQPLKTFLKRDALNYHQNNIAKTYVLVDPDAKYNKIFGYITLVASEVECASNTELDDCESANAYESMPGVKIARLALHKDCRGIGYGYFMYQSALSIIINKVMPHIGCRFLIVDSKPEAVNIYERWGFTFLDTDDNRASDTPVLFIDLHKLG